MLYLNSTTTYYWYQGITDMRKGLDALAGMVQEHMHSNVLQGGVYIFINRKRNQIKLLTWEGDGLAIYYKRLEKGVYELPATAAGNARPSIDALQLQFILQGIVLKSVKKKIRFSLPEKKSESYAH